MTNKYFSFLLRIWQLENQDQHEWFASLEEPKSREVVYFKDMEELSFYVGCQPVKKNLIPVDLFVDTRILIFSQFLPFNS